MNDRNLMVIETAREILEDLRDPIEGLAEETGFSEAALMVHIGLSLVMSGISEGGLESEDLRQMVLACVSSDTPRPVH